MLMASRRSYRRLRSTASEARITSAIHLAARKRGGRGQWVSQNSGLPELLPPGRYPQPYNRGVGSVPGTPKSHRTCAE
jgi:hypothetical protein